MPWGKTRLSALLPSIYRNGNRKTPKMIIVAFDPGKLASWCRMDAARPWEIAVGEVEQMGSGRYLRPSGTHIDELVECADHVVVEEVWTRPKEGAASSFTFGLATGTILGAIAARRKPLELVPPSVWKADSRLAGFKGTAAKKASLAKARELWPGMSEAFRLEKSHGLAEAALIARWFLHHGPGREILGARPAQERCDQKSKLGTSLTSRSS
jgi:hypothetical protein